MGGFLDVRSDYNIYHLKTPNLEQLLSKRIKYIEEYLEKDHRTASWKRLWGEQWGSFEAEIQENAAILKETFLISTTGRQILGLLSAIAWHNVRYFLQTLRRIHASLGNSRDAWSMQEIVASLMIPVGNVSGSAVLPNIYRPPFASFPCYYLKARVLLMLVRGVQAHQASYGSTLSKILTFARFYGYQERWTRRAVEEMVQERLLECLEVPAEEEYTKEYELRDSHSFRPSPLAVVLLSGIIWDPVYICLIGDDLPFHREATFERYKRSWENVMGVLDSRRFERAAISLMIETEVGEIVSHYLVDSFNEERAAGNVQKGVPEIVHTERALGLIIGQLNKAADEPIVDQSENYRTLPLFQFQEGVEEIQPIAPIPIPEGISEVRIGRSTYAPLIFWALVALRKNGTPFASGADIASVINDYLVDDHSRKHSTNVSRSLRSEAVQKQKWLVVTESESGYKYFGLSTDWQDLWVDIFDASPPDISAEQPNRMDEKTGSAGNA